MVKIHGFLINYSVRRIPALPLSLNRDFNISKQIACINDYDPKLLGELYGKKNSILP